MSTKRVQGAFSEKNILTQFWSTKNSHYTLTKYASFHKIQNWDSEERGGPTP